MAGDGERGKRVSESLGWLTESAVMPKKYKAIEGVGAASMVELKAQLYQSQEESRKARDNDPDEFIRAKKKPLPYDVFSHKNSGVDARARRDKIELKAVNDGTASYAALERKAELYDKLARGELSDEEEKEKYCVDFFAKSLVRDEARGSEPNGDPVNILQENQYNIFPNTEDSGSNSTIMDHEEHKRLVREVHEETNRARERATSLKMRRQEQEAARRDKLRQAYLRKQLEKITAAKQQQQENHAPH